MALMDDTPPQDPISELKNADPADSPDVVDRIANELAAELDATESTEGSDESIGAQTDDEPRQETEDES